MTELSSPARDQIYAQHRDDPFLVLLTIAHPDLDDDIRVVANNETVTSRGKEFVGYPFEVSLPSDNEETPKGTLTISNVSKRIGYALDVIQSPPILTFELVLASQPDDVELAYTDFEMTDVTWDARNVKASFSQTVFWDEPWPRMRVTPQDFPGLFP